MSGQQQGEEVPTATLVVRVGYRGAGFSGYAEQPGQRTVAGELRQALECALRREVQMEVAGRTDAGVHALGQFVSVPLRGEEPRLEGRRLAASLVALTPDDLSIVALYQAQPGFSARFDALRRHYRYRIACGQPRPVMGWDHCWWLRGVDGLDLDAMNEGASRLLGEHDFRSFCKASSAQLLEADGRSTCRRLDELRVSRVVEAGEELVAVDVTGNAFLHNMVRAITGSLVEIGRGHRDADWLEAALEARSRAAAGPTAPAQGLCFEGVDYPSSSLARWW